MAKCKHETKNGRCGLKESYAYWKECHTEEFCRCHESIEPCERNEPMTNADRIRAMSDEKLATMFANMCNDLEFCDSCPVCCTSNCPGGSSTRWLEWLKQPAEVE